MTDKHEQGAIAELKALGYGFNKDGELRKIDKITNKLTNQPFFHNHSICGDHPHCKEVIVLYRKLQAAIHELVERNGLRRTYIPHNVPSKEGSFFFSQPERLSGSKKLLVIISEYAGLWDLKLITKKSLKYGTQLQYIKRAQSLGYDLLIMNISETTRLSSGKYVPLACLDTMRKHAAYVWEHHVMPSQPQSVAILAHSLGGMATINLVAKNLDFFEEKVFAIAFMKSEDWHLDKVTSKAIRKRSCNWMVHSAALGTVLPNSVKLSGVPCVSAGPESTCDNMAYFACKSVFRFLETKYAEFENGRRLNEAKCKRKKSTVTK